MAPIEVGTASPDVFGAAGTWTLNSKVVLLIIKSGNLYKAILPPHWRG
jgi:hypothetical protein